jgi:hypothetical protein
MINTLPTCYEVVSGKARPGASAPLKRMMAQVGRPHKHAKHVSLAIWLGGWWAHWALGQREQQQWQ